MSFKSLQEIIEAGDRYIEDKEYYKGIELYKKAKTEGNEEADKKLKEIFETFLEVNEKDQEGQILRYKYAAKCGHVASLIKLGDLYHYGIVVEENYTKARACYIQAALKGNKTAFERVKALKSSPSSIGEEESEEHFILFKGFYSDAINRRKKHARLSMVSILHTGDEESKEDLEQGYNYYYGTGGEQQSFTKAYACYERCIYLDSSEILYILGEMAYYGLGVERSEEEAKIYLERAAMMKHPKAMYQLGNLYDMQSGSNSDKKEAEQWYLESAKHFNAEAIYQLGMLYLKGSRTKEGVLEVSKLFEQSGGLGESNAFVELGALYESLSLRNYLSADFTSNTINAEKYYNKAIKHGNSNGMLRLAKMYRIGLLTGETDLEKAIDLCQLAQYLGNEHAVFELANCYYKKKEYEKAIHLYEEAIEKNNCRLSSQQLAHIYYHGKGDEVCYEKALLYYLHTAQSDNKFSKEIGPFYEEYTSSPTYEEYKKMREFYEYGALRGSKESIWNLAMMYEKGLGGEENIEKAKELYGVLK